MSILRLLLPLVLLAAGAAQGAPLALVDMGGGAGDITVMDRGTIQRKGTISAVWVYFFDPATQPNGSDYHWHHLEFDCQRERYRASFLSDWSTEGGKIVDGEVHETWRSVAAGAPGEVMLKEACSPQSRPETLMLDGRDIDPLSLARWARNLRRCQPTEGMRDRGRGEAATASCHHDR